MQDNQIQIFDLGKEQERNARNLELKNNLFEEIVEKSFLMLDNMSEPLEFSKVQIKQQPQENDEVGDGQIISEPIPEELNHTLVMIEGEIGSGKSTTSTTLMEIQSKACGNKDYLQVDNRFATGRQSGRVTSHVKTVPIGDLSVMDTPGTNDIENELSDLQIGIMKHQNMNEHFSDPKKGIACIIETIMLDGGCRLNQSKVTSLIRMLNSLTYSYPTYNPQTNPGPMIAIIFTNLSRNYSEDDDIGVEGIPVDLAQDPMMLFRQNYKKLFNIVVDSIWLDQDKQQTREQIESKVNIILPFKNFYCYKIYPGDKEKLQKEKEELQRLITDAKSYGNYFIQNFDFEAGQMSMPISFDFHESKYLCERIIRIFQNLVPNAVIQFNQKFNSNFQFYNKKSLVVPTFESKFQQIYKDLLFLLQNEMHALRRTPRQFEQVIQKIEDHLPLYLEKMVDQEIHMTLKQIINDKDSKHSQQIGDMIKTHKQVTHGLEKRYENSIDQYQKDAAAQSHIDDKRYERAQQSFVQDKNYLSKEYQSQIQKFNDKNREEKNKYETEYALKLKIMEDKSEAYFNCLKKEAQQLQKQQLINFQDERQNFLQNQRILKKQVDVQKEICQFKLTRKEEACNDQIKQVKAEYKRLEDYTKKLKNQFDDF